VSSFSRQAQHRTALPINHQKQGFGDMKIAKRNWQIPLIEVPDLAG
jgi:hypothetical protein